jgi:hypothetical protein
MTARKAPAPVTEPVVAPDHAFGNLITSARDAAVIAQQALQNDRIGREEYYDRELQRLTAARDTELKSIDNQIAQQGNILNGCDAALQALTGGNVVALKAVA